MNIPLKKSWVFQALFFMCSLFYVRYGVDPGLYIHSQNPAFFIDSHFLKDFLAYPGGAVEYASSFLTMLCSMPWIGALIITGLAMIITILTGNLLKALRINDTHATISLIPAILLIGLHGNYDHRIQYDVMLTAMLISHSVLRSFSPRNAITSTLFRMCISGLLLYLAGLIPFVLLMTMISIEDAVSKRGWPIVYQIASTLLTGFVLPYLFYNFLFMRSIQFEKEFFQNILTHYVVKYVPALPLLFFPFILISAALLKKAAPLFAHTKKRGTGRELNPRIRHAFTSSFSVFIMLFMSALAFTSMYDAHANRLLRMQKLSNEKRWSAVTTIAAQCAPEDMIVHLMRNRALFHDGKLLDHLFDYPQVFGARGLMFTGDGDARQFIAFNDLAYDLGEMNQAIRWSYEEVSSFGHCPHALRRLALANLVKENYPTAQKMLLMLQQAPLQKQWAKEFLARLERPDALSHDADIMQKRSLLPRNIFSDGNNVEHMTILVNLFYNNKNKMAFEYLLMSLLLEKNLDEFVKYLRFLETFGYKEIPRHIQEALCVYKYTRPDGKRLAEQYPVDQAILQRFLRFSKIIYQHGQNNIQGREILRGEFENTYWYYLRYIYPDIIPDRKNLPNGTQGDPYIQKAGA